MHTRSVLLWLSAIGAGALVAVAPAANASLPTTPTDVPVSAGAVASGIDGHLASAASIAGTVSAAAGGTVNASVTAYLDGLAVQSGFTAAGGSYVIGGLSAGSGYTVCVGGSSAFGGNSTTGYQGRCYRSAAFNGSTVPSNATRFALTAGQHRTGVNINLPSAAAISGRIANGSGGGVSGAFVVAKNRTSGATFTGFTTSNGAYEVAGLTPSTSGYSVCANPAFVTAGSTGYRPHCYNNVAWNGAAIPSGATAVSVSPGHTHTGINIKLQNGAAISGTVSDASNGHPIGFTGVLVFSSTGRFLASASTNARGGYTVKGLAASSSDRVCAIPASGSTAGVSYKGKCWKNVAFNGSSLPSGTTNVATTLGHIRTGIGFKLTRVTVHLGSIAGTITEQAGANALQSASVTLFSSTGRSLRTASTDSSGHFSFTNIAPDATGYEVCAQAVSTTFAPAISTPTGGWAPQCYAGIAWDGGSAAASGATKVPISAGQNESGIDIGLDAGGGISGTTYQFGASTVAGDVTVKVFTPTGKSLAVVNSGVDGTYSFDNLPPSATGYVVCFDGRQAQSGAAGYLPQCWQDQPWDGRA